MRGPVVQCFGFAESDAGADGWSDTIPVIDRFAVSVSDRLAFPVAHRFPIAITHAVSYASADAVADNVQ